MELTTLIKQQNAEGLANFIKSNNLMIDENNKIVATNDESRTHAKRQRDFYDQRQLIKKILLNS